MYEGTNPTALKSQQWLADTLLNLMEIKPYDEISIKDICKNADLSRQTFYNFFDSKDELFRFLLRNCYDDRLKSFERIPTSKEAISAFVATVRNNPRLVSAIVKNNMGNLVSDEIFNSITKFLNNFLSDNSDSFDFSYYIVLISGSLTHFLLYYAKKGEDMSEEKLTRILETFLSGKMFRFLRMMNKTNSNEEKN